MESGWIINFKNGTSLVLSEEKYIKYRVYEDINKVETEEHWFDIKEGLVKLFLKKGEFFTVI